MLLYYTDILSILRQFDILHGHLVYILLYFGTFFPVLEKSGNPEPQPPKKAAA
jgi:hypothetical protein